MKNSNTTA